MKYEAQVVMLPTKDKTPLFKDGHEIVYYPAKNIEFTDVIYQHLFITVSQEVEPIKEGDWAIVTNTAGTEFICKHHNESKWEILGKNNGFITTITGDSRKIIATTDKSLKYSATGYTEDRSRTFYKDLPQIPQQFIKEYVDKGGIDKVNVEYKHSCYIRDSLHDGFKGEWNEISIKAYKYSITNPESLHHNYKEYKDGIKLKLNPDNTIIIHPLESIQIDLSSDEFVCIQQWLDTIHRTDWAGNECLYDSLTTKFKM